MSLLSRIFDGRPTEVEIEHERRREERYATGGRVLERLGLPPGSGPQAVDAALLDRIEQLEADLSEARP